MNRLVETLAALAALVFWLPAPEALAHPVTVDGVADEWMNGRIPTRFNLGLVARDGEERGEYVWRDVPGDARTEIENPEQGADLLLVRITGDRDGLAILVQTAAASIDPQVQIQLAIDLDAVSDSGALWMAGDADTRVNPSAAWEYLIQTRFTSGNNDAQVLNSSFVQVDTVPADAVTDTIEIGVPWSSLGLGAPPGGPLRFTICSLRAGNDDVVTEIGGPGVSDALDCATTYGDPQSAAPYPNSWNELLDQSVDYFFDVFFAPSGEVYSPLLVQAFAPVMTAGEGGDLVLVRNVSPIPLALDGCKLGDEESPDSGEGMRLFPSGVSLGPDESFIVAGNGADFLSAFGWPPDAELAGDTAAPDMGPAHEVWASGSLSLSDGGDHLLLLDGSDTLLDVVVYGSETYPGIIALSPAPNSGEVLARDAVGRDTDDCDDDFTAVAFNTCSTQAPCNVCQLCVGSCCLVEPDGTACSGGDNCIVDETCESGSCGNGSPRDCSAENDPCNQGVCDPVDGACIKSPANENDSCDDGNGCTADDRCSGGVCGGAGTVDCDDGDPCTADSCAPATGQCEHAEIDGCCLDDGECDDGDPCTEDTCSEGGGSCDNRRIAGCGPGQADGGIADGGTVVSGSADSGGEPPEQSPPGGSGGEVAAAGTGGSGEDDRGEPNADAEHAAMDDGGDDAAGGCGCAVVGARGAGFGPVLACLCALLGAPLVRRARRQR